MGVFLLYGYKYMKEEGKGKEAKSMRACCLLVGLGWVGVEWVGDSKERREDRMECWR